VDEMNDEPDNREEPHEIIKDDWEFPQGDQDVFEETLEFYEDALRMVVDEEDFLSSRDLLNQMLAYSGEQEEVEAGRE
jgi:hypothetical protein